METKSPGLQEREELKSKQPYQLTTDEHLQYQFILDRVVRAKEQRDKVREEFDDLCYEDDYELNRRAMNSYLRPKRNDSEVRIVTGTTENRIETIWAEIMNMNLQPDIQAYDKNDNLIDKLGDDMEDVVKRTNEIEMDDERYKDAVMELLTQRAVFVEEVWVDKKLRNGRRVKRCEKRPLSGLQVFLGDISMPAWRFNDQPYVIKYERMYYAEAKTIYGDMKRWEFVKAGSYNANSIEGNNLYRKDSLSSQEVEIFHYMDYPNNEYQIILNGVPMLEVGEALPWHYEGYNITMAILKPMGLDFAYGKPKTASAKTLQALDNESIRNIMRKWRQGIEPPIGVKSGKIYSRDIWDPGAQTQGISDTDFTRLITHDGVTQGEMAVMQMIKDEISEMTGSAHAFIPKGKKPSNAEMMQAKAEATKALGLIVLAVINLKKNMTFLRIYNLLENYTKEQGRALDPVTNKIESIFAKFTVNDTELPNGQMGQKVIQFADKHMSEEQQFTTYAMEQKMSKDGKHVQFRNVNIKVLNKIKPTWYVSVISRDKDSSDLQKALFTDKLSQAGSISTMIQKPLNAKKVVDSFERVWKEKDFFQMDAPPGQSGQPGQTQGPQPAPAGAGKQIARAGAAKPNKPTVNTMLKK